MKIEAVVGHTGIDGSGERRLAVFKMRDGVPSARYSSVCNVLRLWRIWLIPTYGVHIRTL